MLSFRNCRDDKQVCAENTFRGLQSIIIYLMIDNNVWCLILFWKSHFYSIYLWIFNIPFGGWRNHGHIYVLCLTLVIFFHSNINECLLFSFRNTFLNKLLWTDHLSDNWLYCISLDSSNSPNFSKHGISRCFPVEEAT